MLRCIIARKPLFRHGPKNPNMGQSGFLSLGVQSAKHGCSSVELLRKIVGDLHSKPDLSGPAEGLGKPRCHFSGNARLAVNHIAKSLAGSRQAPWLLGHRQVKRFQTIQLDG